MHPDPTPDPIPAPRAGPDAAARPGAESRTPRRTLRLGCGMMAAAALGMLVTVLVAYPYASHFSLPAQVAAHLLLPVAAGVFKLGYVVRLAAHHALGNHAAG